jgi:hypothetical protein
MGVPDLCDAPSCSATRIAVSIAAAWPIPSMTACPTKITFAEMRDSGVRGILILR